MRKSITTNRAPAAIGPYSQAVEAGGFLFTSGQLPMDPASGRLVEGDISMQARQVFENLGAVLSAAGLSFADVVKATVFLADMNDFAAVNAVYAEFFSGEFPARSAVQVARLPKDARLEIEMIACKG